MLHDEMSTKSSSDDLLDDFSLPIKIDSLEQTAQIGYTLGQSLFGGSAIALFGGMGSGKTTLAKSICHGLGVHPDVVISPTYTLVNSYSGRFPILHVDLYRMESQDALSAYDLEDLICFEGITLVEWADFLMDELEELALLKIQILASSETQRMLTFFTKNQEMQKTLQILKNF